ncbi:hypothetical protein [Spiroplasma endosymbiont of Nebria brevicollis]|uniref:hypothetical protein n=1 Tax=Spiroplasma endosymbiont of Nebria brevicollis TaxID=3066284 RepID=UPI00313BE82A
MVEDFIIDLVKLRNNLITISPSKEEYFNEKITKVFKVLRECYEINNREINASEILKKIPNTTQTSYSSKKNNKKWKLTRNCMIHCELKINVLLKNENEIKNEDEILKKVKTLVSNFLLKEQKELSNDWDLIVDEEKLKTCVNNILKIKNNECESETEIADDALEFFKNEINSDDSLYNPPKTPQLHL